MTFDGKRLWRMRYEAKMTREDLAAASGISRNTIYNYEIGERAPDADTLAVLAQIVSTSSSFLNQEIDYPGPLSSRENAMLLKLRDMPPIADDDLNAWLNDIPDDPQLLTPGEQPEFPPPNKRKPRKPPI